ncbi:hypothetical protein FRB90_010682, partial [Tulasnella sp. 427]
YACEFCTKAFTVKCNLIRHLRTCKSKLGISHRGKQCLRQLSPAPQCGLKPSPSPDGERPPSLSLAPLLKSLALDARPSMQH